jgi:hypothetical protein
VFAPLAAVTLAAAAPTQALPPEAPPFVAPRSVQPIPRLDVNALRRLAGEAPLSEADLAARIAAAATQPLGSADNPVRAEMPAGQRAYIARLRCPDGAAPDIAGRFNIGLGPFGGVVDAYRLDCRSDGVRTLHLDMYHPGHRETAAAAGWTIAPD